MAEYFNGMDFYASSLVAPATIGQYLTSHGYPRDSSNWLWSEFPFEKGRHPVISLSVEGHEESEGHTWYIVKCSFVWPSKRTIRWTVRRRLMHLREHLLERVRDTCECYNELFHDTPFAMRMGPPGTTLRLQAWCAKLATAMNSGKANPTLTVIVLHFFDFEDAIAKSEGRQSERPVPMRNAEVDSNSSRQSKGWLKSVEQFFDGSNPDDPSHYAESPRYERNSTGKASQDARAEANECDKMAATATAMVENSIGAEIQRYRDAQARKKSDLCAQQAQPPVQKATASSSGSASSSGYAAEKLDRCSAAASSSGYAAEKLDRCSAAASSSGYAAKNLLPRPVVASADSIAIALEEDRCCAAAKE
eukprot:gnl/TRDRNA2_/TRDRNA2_87568_c0_seq1.p1 gnl/TRDRNA2_/TRDRNA2_87568_c0~~gnl/TRDRNA2_/TRDRNA2_87568_c0_seq1.p1  ORF type:complete len:363 (+),score=60.82 gnl/TRDRNA2_/TRDRNA2_87568_c0_seq1:32-1120(+)